MRWLWLAAACVLGCGGARARWEPAAHRLCQGDLCYRVGDLGPGWRVARCGRASIGFFSDEVGAVVEATASCRDDAEAAPLESLTHQLLIGYTDRVIERREEVRLAGRAALHTEVRAALDGVPVRLDVYVLKRNGCIFDLAYAAPAARFEAGRAAFARFVRGFVDERTT